eukprot:SAG31_NODE_2847_length_5006_cov_5.023028_2_plen_62_part_00
MAPGVHRLTRVLEKLLSTSFTTLQNHKINFSIRPFRPFRSLRQPNQLLPHLYPEASRLACV